MNDQENDHQQKSDAYWVNATTTYLAAAEYYDLQEQRLKGIFQSHGPFGSGLDIGCGDGRYTELAAQYSGQMLGVDLGPELIQQAINNRGENDNNPEYKVGSISDPIPTDCYDLIMCLGVTSALIDESLFKSSIAQFKQGLKNSGTLLTKDTLTFNEAYVSQQGDYIATYRNRETYIAAFENAGFKLFEEVELLQNTGVTSNSIFIFKHASE